MTNEATRSYTRKSNPLSARRVLTRAQRCFRPFGFWLWINGTPPDLPDDFDIIWGV